MHVSGSTRTYPGIHNAHSGSKFLSRFIRVKRQDGISSWSLIRNIELITKIAPNIPTRKNNTIQSRIVLIIANLHIFPFVYGDFAFIAWPAPFRSNSTHH